MLEGLVVVVVVVQLLLLLMFTNDDDDTKPNRSPRMRKKAEALCSCACASMMWIPRASQGPGGGQGGWRGEREASARGGGGERGSNSTPEHLSQNRFPSVPVSRVETWNGARRGHQARMTARARFPRAGGERGVV